ncbi:MAG: endo alpha-1,4 polygalactosaminidase [Gammaproteobacteria bacterium]
MCAALGCRGGLLAALAVTLVTPVAAWPDGAPCALAYVLQAERLSAHRLEALEHLARAARDTVVIDRVYAGLDDPWSIPELESLRSAHPGRRVLAYFSIGEAEDYRPYWMREWGFDATGAATPATPAFVVAPNPDWPGNYKVRYWERGWQALVLAQLDELVGNEFDGAYLDIVDAFQFFEHDAAADTWQALRENPATGRSYREDMVRWVRRIARHARARRDDFLVIPQNGSALLHFPEYLATIDAIAVEDLFTLDDVAQAREHTVSVLADLELARAARKPVFVIEYASDPALQARARDEAAARGFVLLFTDRELTTLGRAVAPPRCTTPP